MCAKRLGLSGTRQGVQFNQVRGTLMLQIYVWFIWNLGWPEHAVFLFALAGNSVGDKILAGATEQTESQLYSLVLGLHCQANSQCFLGVLRRATVHPQHCQTAIWSQSSSITSLQSRCLHRVDKISSCLAEWLACPVEVWHLAAMALEFLMCWDSNLTLFSDLRWPCGPSPFLFQWGPGHATRVFKDLSEVWTGFTLYSFLARDSHVHTVVLLQSADKVQTSADFLLCRKSSKKIRPAPKSTMNWNKSCACYNIVIPLRRWMGVGSRDFK